MAGGDIDAGDAAVLPYSEGQLRGGAQGLEQAHGDAVARHDAGGLSGEEAGVVAAVKADGYAPGGGLRSLRGAQGLEQAHGDAVARHDAGGLSGEEAGVVAAVKADGYAPGGGLRSLLQDHLGKGLGGVTDHMNIHAVQTYTPGGLPGEEAGVVAAVKADGHATGGGLRSLLQDHMGKGLGGVTDHMNIHAVQTYTHSAAQTGGAEGQLVKKAGLDLLLIPADGLQFRFFLLRKGGTVQPVLIIFPIRHICKTSCV